MSFLNTADILANEYNFTPLPRTWYEEESDTEQLKTIRFAKRVGHTGVLIRINKSEFYEANNE